MRTKGDNILSEDEIIEQARGAFARNYDCAVCKALPYGACDYHNAEISDVLQACEEFYMNGCADDIDGDVETFGHFYRVHRWIVWTDSQGFRDLETHDSEEDAVKAFESYSEDYSKTFDTEESF